jgi:hypothetical protein
VPEYDDFALATPAMWPLASALDRACALQACLSGMTGLK